MHLQQFPDFELRKLNELVHDYCTANDSLRYFFEVPPLRDEIAKYGEQRSFSSHHYAVLHEVLLDQYTGYSREKTVDANIEAIGNRQAVTVTTGHQLCLFGGPAYLLYKVLCTIKLAQVVQASTNELKVVPVFWLASEDHDRDEINHAFFKNKRFQWDTLQQGAVGRFRNDEFGSLISQWVEAIEDDGLRNQMNTIWRKAEKSSTWAHATKSWIHDCFGEWGLVTIDADDARLKRLFTPCMKKELSQQITYTSVIETNDKLAQRGYSAQVNPRLINLFYLSDQYRVRIEKKEDVWSTVDGLHQWSETSIENELDEHPENFSPNVLLRPLYQETILPNIAYVGGPGELAYWLQLRSTFDAFNVMMPALVLRDSAILLSAGGAKRLAKLGLSNKDILRDKSQLIDLLVGKDKEEFQEERLQLQKVYDQIAAHVARIDPTLKAAAMAELQRVLSGIDQLASKAWKAEKLKQEQKFSSLDKLWEELYPNGKWQERSENVLTQSMANDKQLMHALLAEFQTPKSTLVMVVN